MSLNKNKNKKYPYFFARLQLETQGLFLGLSWQKSEVAKRINTIAKITWAEVDVNVLWCELNGV